jgi:hypothetical protein
VVADGRLWVPNGNAVTEINARTGALIRVLGGRPYRFRSPDVAGVAGNDVWIGNFNRYSVDEIDARTGALLHIAWALPNYPFAITANSGSAWVAVNAGAKGADGPGGPGGSIVWINASTGQVIRVISSPSYRVGFPWSVAVAGNAVWIADQNYPGGGGSVTEINATTGALIRVISGSS